jgi:hypothetical protein
LPTRRLAGYALSGDRHGVGQIGLRMLQACTHRGVGRSPGLSKNARGLLADRLRKLPVERVVILEREQHEPKGVVVAQPESLLHSIELLSLGRLRFPTEQLFEG